MRSTWLRTSLLLLMGMMTMSAHADVPFRIAWSLGPPMPQYRKGGVLGVVDGYVVYAGGMQHPWREPEESLVYDPGTQAWEATAPLPIGPSYSGGVSDGKVLYVLGGRKAGSRCFRLTREAGRWYWTELPALTQPRVLAANALVGGWWIAAGGGWGMRFGAFDPTPVTVVEGLDLTHPDRGWQQLPHYPGFDRPAAMGASCAGRFYMFGGHRSMEQGMTAPDGYQANHLCPRLADAYSYDPVQQSWKRLADLPTALCGGAAVAYRDRYIILLGGSHMSVRACEFPFEGETIGGYNAQVFVYDTVTDSYTLLAEPLPAGVNDLRLCRIGDTLYCAGGESIDKRTSNTVNLLQIGHIEPR